MPGFETIQVKLLVWIFVMRIMMVVASGASYLINGAIAKARFGNASKMNFETPLTTLVWLTSIVSVVLLYVVSYFMIPTLGDGSLWWKALDGDHVRDARRRDHSRVREGLHVDRARTFAKW